MARIDYMTHYHDRPWQTISRGDNRKLWNSGQMLSSLAHSSLEVIVVIGYSSLLLKIT